MVFSLQHTALELEPVRVPFLWGLIGLDFLLCPLDTPFLFPRLGQFLLTYFPLSPFFGLYLLHAHGACNTFLTDYSIFLV